MATHISVELVPRSTEGIVNDARVVARYPEVTHLNVTDLGRFPLRSVDAVQLLRDALGDRFVYIPHIPAPRFPHLILSGNFSGDVTLVVSGDTSSGSHHPVTAIECMNYLRGRMPIMGGIDPYRSSTEVELAYIERKRSAGAKGFFTQPFFSIDHLRYWDSVLPRDAEIFYGVSPVVSEASERYWRTMNHVVFPAGFVTSLPRQVTFARRVIRWARKHNRSVYLMPIKTPLDSYLARVFR